MFWAYVTAVSIDEHKIMWLLDRIIPSLHGEKSLSVQDVWTKQYHFPYEEKRSHPSVANSSPAKTGHKILIMSPSCKLAKPKKIKNLIPNMILVQTI